MSRNLLSLRYVDNRLWISERRVEQLPGVKLFLNSRFYGGDIIPYAHQAATPSGAGAPPCLA